MSQQDEYTPPAIWTPDDEMGGTWGKLNRPTAGATFDRALPVGEHGLQLYSLATPNGQKVTIMLEELLEAGEQGAEYDAYLIDISEGDQFSTGFVEINPNSKIPALVDHTGDQPVRVFESGAILLHLAEKFGRFLPTDHAARTETLNWLFWLHGAAPFLGGGFGHFYNYAPYKMKYPINRYTMEVKRHLDLLDKHLADHCFLAGDQYTIADIATWPWYGLVARGEAYNAGEFLQVQEYTHLQRWMREINERPAVKRGAMVNRAWGEPSKQLRERHAASDFELRTQDKLAPDAG